MKRKTKNNSESLLILKDKDINNETIPIEKVHIYNNNRHLQKSNSAGNIRLFFEPYYSELKNSTNNSLFNTKQLKKTILQIEYVNFPKVDDNLLEETRPERYLQKKNVFANNDNNIRGYNNYNINDYNNTYGRNDYYRYNNVNINRLPKINNNIHYNYNEYNNNYNTNNNNRYNNYNNFGHGNKYNQGYDYNDYQYDDNNYYRRRELGELYSQTFLSRDNINDMNYKIRNYYINSIDRPSNNDRLFNYNRMRNNPRNYTSKGIKKDDIIINDIKASRKYREFVFFQNLKKYIEPEQSIIDEDKKSKISSESNFNRIGKLRKKSDANKIIEEDENKKEKKEMVKQMIEALKTNDKKKEDKKSDKESSEDDEEEEEEESDSEDKNKKEKKKETKKEETKEKQETKNSKKGQNKENKKEETKEKQETKNNEAEKKKETSINKKEEEKKEEEKKEEKKESKDNVKKNKDKKEEESESSEDEEEEEEEDDEEDEKKK